ncbi:nucleotide disphospho-sugar-binding domain-containing protein [Streptomyces sp. NPDC048417]|uniref:nucleotide disphospho-sugar-binding domain-containing protein n=1 Tax=Streptomyces sp. NPDC048417 TaxID=3155387 RepID=UPI00341C0DC5
MRVALSALVPSHLLPMVPLAWALQAAGHEVLVIADQEVARTAVAAGLAATEITPADVAGADVDVPGTGRDHGLVRTEAYLPDWLRLATAWSTDLLVTDPLDHAGWITAGALGITLVVHRYGPEAFSTRLHRKVEEPLRPVAVAAGSAGGLPRPALIVDPSPPSMRSPDLAPGHPVRFVPYGGGGTTPAWALLPPAGRRVAVCLGIWGGARYATDGLPSAFRQVIEVSAATPGVETVFLLPPGRRAGVGPLPATVRVADPLPLGHLAPGCDLIVHHGGAGTALTALAHGVPQLVLPPDQPFLRTTAELVAGAHAGRAVPDAATAERREVSEAFEDLLSAPGYAAAANRLAAEIRSQPGPAELVAVLERLV